MKSKLKLILKIFMIILLFPALTGCKNKSNSENLRIAYEYFATLNPIVAQSRADWNILYLTQSQLVRFYEGKIDYDAATSFKTNKDFTVYTFSIREGLKWSDGSALDANDFAYGIYSVLSPSTASPKASSFYGIKNAKKFAEGKIKDFNKVGVKVINDLTLEITLESPIVDYEKTIASVHFYPLSEDFVKKIGIKEYGTSVDTILCSGPYIFKEWGLDSKLVLEKNENYWDAENTFLVPGIEFYKVENASTALNMYDNNEVDVVLNIDNEHYEMYEDESYVGDGGSISFLWFNQYSKNKEVAKIFANQNFRRALNYAINREEIVSTINSANTAFNNMVAPSFISNKSDKTFNEDYPVNAVPLKGDYKKAKKHLQTALKELGYKNVSELPKIKFISFIDDAQKLENELIIDKWKQVLGISNIEYITYDIGAAIGVFYDLSYDIFSIGIETSVRPSDLMESLTSGNTYNAGIYKNKEFDKLIADAIKESNTNKKAELIQKANQIMVDDSIIVPLHYNGYKSAVKPYVEGYSLGAVDGFEFQKLHIN